MEPDAGKTGQAARVRKSGRRCAISLVLRRGGRAMAGAAELSVARAAGKTHRAGGGRRRRCEILRDRNARWQAGRRYWNKKYRLEEPQGRVLSDDRRETALGQGFRY